MANFRAGFEIADATDQPPTGLMGPSGKLGGAGASSSICLIVGKVVGFVVGHVVGFVVGPVVGIVAGLVVGKVVGLVVGSVVGLVVDVGGAGGTGGATGGLPPVGAVVGLVAGGGGGNGAPLGGAADSGVSSNGVPITTAVANNAGKNFIVLLPDFIINSPSGLVLCGNHRLHPARFHQPASHLKKVNLKRR